MKLVRRKCIDWFIVYL